VDGHLDVCEDRLALNTTHLHGGNRYQLLTDRRKELGLATAKTGSGAALRLNWVTAPLLTFICAVTSCELPPPMGKQLRGICSAHPEFPFVEHFLNQVNPDFIAALNTGDHRLFWLIRGTATATRWHTLWSNSGTCWSGRMEAARCGCESNATAWLEQGKQISVKNAPTYFGAVGYQIVSERTTEDYRDRGNAGTPGTRSVWLRLRHPTALRMKSVTVNGKPGRISTRLGK